MKKATKRRGRKKAAAKAPTKKTSKPRRRRKSKSTAAPSKPKAKAGRRYTPAERAKILAAAKAEGLTGVAAAKRFGISMLTFYTWRKKAGSSPKADRKPRRPAGSAVSDDFSGDIRSQVQTRVRELLPEIVRQEVATAVGEILSGRGRTGK